MNGFDRLRFRGTLRWLCYADGLGKYLSWMKVLLKDFSDFTQGITGRIRQAAEQIAESAGRPVEYLASPSRSKEERARTIAKRDGIEEGLIRVLSAVEPCRSFRIARDRSRKELVLQTALRMCLHYRSDAPAARRRQSAAVTRKLRRLRAHGLIRKVPRTHRYLLTDKGRQCITALLAAQAADTAKLTRAA